MSDLEAIAAPYQQVDNSLEDLRDRFDAAGDARERDRVARQQRLNEQAYFALALGHSHEDWRHRRAWSLYSDNPRLSFRNRLTLVLDQSSDEFRRTTDLHDARNQIANGSLRSEGIDVSIGIERPQFVW